MQWEDIALTPFASCLGPWQGCRVPVIKGQDGNPQVCHVEFYIEGPKNAEDRPLGGGNYRLAGPGGYKLQLGELRPFPQAREAPYMLVCVIVSLKVAL
jgi:hypothetical protein